MNFSYPSLEEPKLPPPPQPEPVVTSELQEPSTPAMVNGDAPAEPPTSKTSTVAQKLPDVVDSSVANPTNSGPDPSNKVPASGNAHQSPATTKALPQVLNATSILSEARNYPPCLIFLFHFSLTVRRSPRAKCQMRPSTARMDPLRIPAAQLSLNAQQSHRSVPTRPCLKKNKVRSTLRPWQ